MNTTSTKIELPSHAVSNLTDGAHSDHGSSTGQIMAFTESRLQHWLAADDVHQGQREIDALLSAPPIRRITMPTANLEPPRLGHLLSSMVSKLVPVRVFRLRHRHSTGS